MLTNEVIVDPPIEKPRQLKKAVYVLRLAEGKLPKLPDAAGPARLSSQSVRMLDERTAEVTVAVKGGFKAPAKDPKWKPPVVMHSTMVDGKDEAVVALTEKATAKVKGGPGERAEAMRQFVHAFIDEKNLGVGFASASEVARTATGDCSEHALLLAAMLRADGIPSRTASGLIYVRRDVDQPGQAPSEQHRDCKFAFPLYFSVWPWRNHRCTWSTSVSLSQLYTVLPASKKRFSDAISLINFLSGPSGTTDPPGASPSA